MWQYKSMKKKPTKIIQAPTKSTIRINKHMADSGLTSRRQADELILSGSVFVNGKKAVMGMQVNPVSDKVEVKGKKASYVYYMFNKPIGIVTTGAQKEEQDIISYTKFPTQVFPVGRLDKDSHGLILLTNDRRITHRLLDPKFEHEKEYRVTIAKGVTGALIKKLEKGVELDGVKTKPVRITRESDNTFRIILTEGRNRQIRKMVESAGDMVTDLLRLRIENIKLGDLQNGAFKGVPKSEIAQLLSKLGLNS
jgi:pseudouridine synthase